MTTRQRWTLTAAVLGSSVVFVDSTVVNVALPRIGRDVPTTWFGVLEAQSYVYNGYLLALSALLILAGALSDYYGRKRMFLVGLVGFGATSVLCGVAPTMELLVAGRVLQGAAGALLVPGSLAILTAAFTGEARGRAFGIWAAASSATTILGPFIGGILVDTISWRAAFLINVPLVAVAAWATVAHVEETRNDDATGRFDWLGAAVVALGTGGLTFGAIYGQQREWQDPLAYIALAAGVVAIVIFPFLMMRRRDPLVPLGLFRSRNFAVTNVSTFLIYGALYVTFYYLALMQQGVLGYTAAAAGLAGLPGGLPLVLFSTRFGTLAARYGPRLFMSIGPTLMAVGVLWFARTPADSSAWLFAATDVSTWVPSTGYLVDFLPGQIVFGVGLAVMVTPLTTALMTSVPERNSGVASAINNAISRVGPQLAGAAIFVAITASFYHGMAARLPGVDTSDAGFRRTYAPLNVPARADARARAVREQSTEAFHLAVLVGAALCAAGGIVNALGISNQVALAASKQRGPPSGEHVAPTT
jgi:EmrB/QacA subfamily drug resistance transporter